jgi:hypothetical protein
LVEARDEWHPTDRRYLGEYTMTSPLSPLVAGFELDPALMAEGPASILVVTEDGGPSLAGTSPYLPVGRRAGQIQ